MGGRPSETRAPITTRAGPGLGATKLAGSAAVRPRGAEGALGRRARPHGPGRRVPAPLPAPPTARERPLSWAEPRLGGDGPREAITGATTEAARSRLRPGARRGPSACVVRGGAAAAEAAPQPVAISRLPTCCTARRGPGWKRPLALAPRRRPRLPALRRSGGRGRAGMRGRKGSNFRRRRRGARVGRRPDEKGRGAPPRFGVPEAARSAAQRPGTGRSSREPNPRRGEARGRRCVPRGLP